MLPHACSPSGHVSGCKAGGLGSPRRAPPKRRRRCAAATAPLPRRRRVERSALLPRAAMAPKEEFKPKSNSKAVMNAPKGGKASLLASGWVGALRRAHSDGGVGGRSPAQRCRLPRDAPRPRPCPPCPPAGQGREARRGKGQEAGKEGLWGALQPDQEVSSLLVAGGARGTAAACAASACSVHACCCLPPPAARPVDLPNALANAVTDAAAGRSLAARRGGRGGQGGGGASCIRQRRPLAGACPPTS